jgi:putative hemolysin
MSDYCVQCFGSGWNDGGCVNLCASCEGSGRGPDVDAMRKEISRLRMVEAVWKLQKHMPAAMIEALEEIERLEAESESLRKDAERYRWLREAKGLSLRSDGSKWTRSSGEQFICSHHLCAFDTSYAPFESLDEVVDAAISSPENH